MKALSGEFEGKQLARQARFWRLLLFCLSGLFGAPDPGCRHLVPAPLHTRRIFTSYCPSVLLSWYDACHLPVVFF
jgi:hypothetical protein